MSNKLSDRIRGVNLLSIPQSPSRAGFVQTTIEDTSAWPVVDGVKQKDGWVYLDGSTIDNSSGKYNEFVALNGGDSLPEGPFETDLVDLTLTTSIAGFNETLAIGQAYKLGDQWRLDFSIRAIMDSVSGFSEVNIEGVTFYGDTANSNNDQTVTSLLIDGFGYVRGNTSKVFINTTDSQTIFMVSGDVALESKPTWFDANISQYPIAKLYSDSGSVSISTDNLVAKDVSVSGDLGVSGDIVMADGAITNVNKWQEKNLSGIDVTTTGPVTGSQFNNLIVGKVYRYTANLNMNDTQATSDGRIHLVHSGLNIQTRVFQGSGNGTTHNIVFDCIFVATSSSVILNIQTLTDCILDASNSGITTEFKIEELNNYTVETTDFT